MDHDFYIAKFDLEEDREFVLTDGPWVIARQYLTIHKLRAGFLPTTEAITRMAVWIRISSIQMEYSNVWVMKMISNILGKLLKININTNSHSRGKFARIFVEIDLTKPLEAFIQINNVWYNLEYKGMPKICFKCGRYGHKRETCDLNVKHVGEEADEVGMIR